MSTTTNNIVATTPEVDANASSNMTDDIACYLTSDPQVTQSYQIYLVATILFVATGLIGNTLSFLVFSSRPMLRFSSNVYLLILAVSDSLFLVSVFLSKVLTTLRCLYFSDSSFDVVNRNSVICKVLQYCNDLFSDYSTCLILGFTVERYAAAYLPIAFKRTCTNRRARIVCATTFVFIALFIAPYHALFMGRHIDYNICIVLIKHEEEFVVLYIVEVVLFRIVPVLAIAVLNVFIIAKVSRITRQRTRIAANDFRGTRCYEPDPLRSSGRRLAQTSGREFRGDRIVCGDGIREKQTEGRGVGLTGSGKPTQINIRSLGRIQLIQPTPLELELPNRMIQCQSETDIPDKVGHINLRDSDHPGSRRQSVNTETVQLKEIESVPPELIPSTRPENLSDSTLERFDIVKLECAKELVSNLPEFERQGHCRSSQREYVESDYSETLASTLPKHSCPEGTKLIQPGTEFAEPERLASEFAQPAKPRSALIQSERLETVGQQPLEFIEPKTNSTNGCCIRHVISSTSGKNRNKKEKKTGRKGSVTTEIIEARKNGRADAAPERRNDCRRDGQRDDRSLQMTVTLILVSTIHVIVFLPVLVHFVIWKLERSKVIQASPAAMQIAQNHTRVLYVAGFAVNFFLYTVSGRMFREQLRAVLFRRRSSVRSGN